MVFLTLKIWRVNTTYKWWPCSAMTMDPSGQLMHIIYMENSRGRYMPQTTSRAPTVGGTLDYVLSLRMQFTMVQNWIAAIRSSLLANRNIFFTCCDIFSSWYLKLVPFDSSRSPESNGTNFTFLWLHLGTIISVFLSQKYPKFNPLLFYEKQYFFQFFFYG